MRVRSRLGSLYNVWRVGVLSTKPSGKLNFTIYIKKIATVLGKVYLHSLVCKNRHCVLPTLEKYIKKVGQMTTGS